MVAHTFAPATFAAASVLSASVRFSFLPSILRTTINVRFPPRQRTTRPWVPAIRHSPESGPKASTAFWFAVTVFGMTETSLGHFWGTVLVRVPYDVRRVQYITEELIILGVKTQHFVVTRCTDTDCN